MNRLARLAAGTTISALLFCGVAIAQDDHHDDAHHQTQDDHRDDAHQQTYVRHTEWHRGAKINHDDWARGEQVDWHAHHLRQPPRGYEWREVDGNYVLAAVATGVIASAIVASAAH